MSCRFDAGNSSVYDIMNDATSDARSELTNDEVRDAVALINECLTDQDIRNKPLTTANSQHAIASIPNLIPAGVEPDSSPVQPDYFSDEISRLYPDKSAEYALPEKDVIHKILPTRTAKILVQENALAPSRDKYLDNVIINMVASKSPTVRVNPTWLHSHRTGVHNASCDSAHDSIARKAIFNSDIDNGIDGSARLTARSDNTFRSGQKAQRYANESKNRDRALIADHNRPLTSKALEANKEEDEEEKRVREEIETTQKRLAWLQAQQVSHNARAQHFEQI